MGSRQIDASRRILQEIRDRTDVVGVLEQGSTAMVIQVRKTVLPGM